MPEKLLPSQPITQLSSGPIFPQGGYIGKPLAWERYEKELFVPDAPGSSFPDFGFAATSKTLTERLAQALSLYELLDEKRNDCEECDLQDSAENCPVCSGFADDARVAMRTVLEEYRTIRASVKLHFGEGEEPFELFDVPEDDSTRKVLVEIAAERERQDAKFGEQNIPLVDQVLMTRPGGCDPHRMAEHFEIPPAYRAQFLCDSGHRNGDLTWTHILVEELAEAVEAGVIKNPSEARTELVQLAAVAVAAVECIDRAAKTGSEAR